jgi:hypothetical protein
MQGLSERQYAAHAGLSRGAVQKAKASGRLEMFPDGSIDAAASDARRAATTDPSKSHRKSSRPAAVSAPPEAASSVRETLKEGGFSPGPRLSYFEARTAHEIAKAHLARLRLQERRGELVDRARAVGLVFRLAREERDAWLTWPARCASLIAAELGVDDHELQTLLEHHVRRHLDELSDLRLELR